MSRFSKQAIAGIKRKIEPIVDDAWGQVTAKLDITYDEVISDDTGKYFPDFPGQDIIDTSRFINSKIISAVKRKVTWLWDPVDPDSGYHYARALLNGFWAFGTTWVPARDWIEATFLEVQPIQMLADLLTQSGLNVRIIN